jgi:hypothetical protein
MKNAVRRLGFGKGFGSWRFFDGNIGRQRSFFNWGKPAGLPYQTSVTVDDRLHGPDCGKRGATMAMIVLSSPATLTRAQEKKTGPSRLIADFLTELTELSKFRI